MIVSGYMAKKNAPVTWQGTTVTTTNKTGAFYFTTTVLPPTCMGTVSDGVTPLNVAIGGCRPVLTAAFPATG